MDFNKIKEAAQNYEADMTKFLRDIVKFPGESCDEEAHVNRIAEEMKKLGKEAVSKVLSFEIIPADKYISKALKIKENSNVHRITRLRLVDSIPLIFEKAYLSTEKFDFFSIDELSNSSLCNILKNRFSVKFSKGEETFYPITPDDEITRYLNLMKFQPVIKIERTTFEDEIPVMFTERIIRGDKFKYTITTSF